MAGTDSTTVAREVVPLKVQPDLVAWVKANSQAGGIFGSYSHGIERGLARLRLEHNVIRARCKQHGVPFRANAFWSLYKDDLEATAPGKAGRPALHEEERATRSRAYASVAIDLVSWARQTLLAGPFQTMSQVVEVGIRRIQGDEPTQEGVPRAPFDPEAWWRRYQREAGQA